MGISSSLFAFLQQKQTEAAQKGMQLDTSAGLVGLSRPRTPDTIHTCWVHLQSSGERVSRTCLLFSHNTYMLSERKHRIKLWFFKAADKYASISLKDNPKQHEFVHLSRAPGTVSGEAKTGEAST